MLFPYRVDVPMARWPIANWVLMGLTILVSFAMFIPLSQWEGPSPDSIQPGLYPVQINPDGKFVVLPNIAPGAAAETPSYPAVVDYFLLQPGHFRVTQLVGNLLIHEGFIHLAGNMLFLFVFGNAVNAKLGHAKFLALYFSAGIFESIAWLVVGPGMPCLGASGAIMGIVGAYLLLYPLNDVSVGYMLSLFYRGTFPISGIWLVAFYVAFDVWGLVRGGNSGTAYLAHVVGFATGATMTAALLRFKVVEMDPGEKSLLQVFKIMHHADHAPKPKATVNAYSPRATPMSAAPGRLQPSPRTRKKDDDGPIPLV